MVNRYDFKDLSGLEFDWIITRDGVEAAKGRLQGVRAAAASTQQVAIKLPALGKRAGELVLTVRASAKTGVVGWSQFVLAPAAAPALAGGFVKPVRGAAAVTLTSAKASLSVDAATGLVTYSANGKTLLKGGSPNFWRGLTDNDEGTGVDKSHKVWHTFTEQRILRSLDVGADRVKVSYSYGAGAAHWETTYRMTNDGVVQVAAAFTPVRDDLPDPLRLGLRFDSDPSLAILNWYGRGPQESYSDRKTGYAIGLYTGKVADQYHNYSRPQESGNKTDVRWMSLVDTAGAGLKVRGAAPIAINALAFPYEDLYLRPRGAWKNSEIAPHGDGTLLIDMAQVGVGGDTGWSLDGRAHAKYRIKLEPASYSFTIAPAAR